MATRLTIYRMIDGLTRLSESYFNPIWADIDSRLDTLEKLRADWKAAVAEVQEFGLERIDSTLVPVLEESRALLVQIEEETEGLAQTLVDTTLNPIIQDFNTLITAAQADADTLQQFLANGDWENRLEAVESELTQKAAVIHGHSWTDIAGKPNSLSGYGIADAYPKSDINTLLAQKVGFLDHYSMNNLIINGDFRINQRDAVARDMGLGVYGFDRWRGAQGGLICQEIEANFLLPTTVTLSWSGGALGALDSGSEFAASPITKTIAAGQSTFLVYVPDGAEEVKVEQGSHATPFCSRPIGLELLLCYRYYYVTQGNLQLYLMTSSNYLRRYMLWFPVPMRTAPTVSEVWGTNGSASIAGAPNSKNVTFTLNAGSASGVSTVLEGVTCDAEL